VWTNPSPRWRKNGGNLSKEIFLFFRWRKKSFFFPVSSNPTGEHHVTGSGVPLLVHLIHPSDERDGKPDPKVDSVPVVLWKRPQRRAIGNWSVKEMRYLVRACAGFPAVCKLHNHWAERNQDISQSGRVTAKVRCSKWKVRIGHGQFHTYQVCVPLVHFFFFVSKCECLTWRGPVPCHGS
jgi:hypothetical protein